MLALGDEIAGRDRRLAVVGVSESLLVDNAGVGRRLLPLLRESTPSRIVSAASVAQPAIDFDDVMLEEEYEGTRAYAQSKLALARELTGLD